MTRCSRRGTSRHLIPGILLCVLLAAAAPAAGQTTFRGTVLYEKIPATSAGLQLDAAGRTPAAGIKVEIVESPSRTVLGSGFTDDKGAYTIPVRLQGRAQVYVRALAQTENASVVRVRDRAEFSIVSPVLAATRGRAVTQDMLATDSSRIAGAFNIAVTIWKANSLVRAGQPDVRLPRVEIRWDTTYVGGTFFREGEGEGVAFINGKRGEDSDEFDDHVIAHEYGHFLMARFSRESSPGGSHGFGERLDPRLAWSEGWGNFFAGATTGIARYIDTGVVRGRQGVLVSFDVEQDVPRGDRPGIWSEHSVSSLLWDWFDDGAEEGDSVALGFAPLWAGLVALGKEPDVYVIRYANAVDGITRESRRLGEGLAARSIAYPLGERPPAREPFPEPIVSGETITATVDSRGTRRSNLWGSSLHYWFVLTEPRQVTISMKITEARTPERADLDLYLFDAEGEPVAESNAVNGVGDGERISRRLQPGYYRIEVRSWANAREGRLSERGAHQGTFSLVARY